jgi:hypothetical protein
MREVIEIIVSGCAGIIIGLSFGYIVGFNSGYNKANEWYKKKENNE